MNYLKMGGQPLVQRLGDKDYSWNAIGLLIPDMIAAGLVGYAYACPDMIGGGQFGSFLDVDQTKLDQELIVRSCQVHALLPKGQWKDDTGKKFRGPKTIEVEAPLERLPWFEKIK